MANGDEKKAGSQGSNIVSDLFGPSFEPTPYTGPAPGQTPFMGALGAGGQYLKDEYEAYVRAPLAKQLEMGVKNPLLPFYAPFIYGFTPTPDTYRVEPFGPGGLAEAYAGAGAAAERRRQQEAKEREVYEERPDLAGVVNPFAGGGMTAAQIDPSQFASLFALEQTPQERAAIEAELADLQQRAEAGSAALASGWAQVSQTNRIASDRARLMAAQAGRDAQAMWTNAAQQALRTATQRANLESSAAGMQSVNISPDAGVQDWVGFMQAQAPRAGLFAQRTGDVLSRDLAYLAESSEAQGQAYQGELVRTAAIQAANAAREHNRAVLSRIASERQALASLTGQAVLTNAQLAQSASQFNAAQAREAAQFDPFDTFLKDMIKVKTAPSIYTQPMMEKYGLSREAVERYANSAASSIGVAQGLAQGTAQGTK